MNSNARDFRCSGPVHLTHVDWTNDEHRMMVAASLAKSASVLEYDHRKGTRLALPWATFFHFNLIDVVECKIVGDGLLDEMFGSSIVGAIYEFKPPLPAAAPPQGAPRYAIAFRGTILKSMCFIADMTANLEIILHIFRQGKRSQIAASAVEGVVFGTNKKLPPTSHAFEPNVWLVGYSLGAAMAVHAGRYMATKKGVLLEHCFLFNPPFPSLEKFLPKMVKPALLKIHNLVVDAGAYFLRDDREHSKDRERLERLAKWSPRLFVNRHDFICSRYISYFKDPQMHSLRGVVMNALFSSRSSDSDGDDEPFDDFYRLPSAHLIVNTSAPSDTREAHKLHHWWKVKKEHLEHTKHVWG